MIEAHYISESYSLVVQSGSQSIDYLSESPVLANDVGQTPGQYQELVSLTYRWHGLTFISLIRSKAQTLADRLVLNMQSGSPPLPINRIHKSRIQDDHRTVPIVNELKSVSVSSSWQAMDNGLSLSLCAYQIPRGFQKGSQVVRGPGFVITENFV
jgi:hypothetical protein